MRSALLISEAASKMCSGILALLGSLGASFGGLFGRTGQDHADRVVVRADPGEHRVEEFILELVVADIVAGGRTTTSTLSAPAPRDSRRSSAGESGCKYTCS